MRVSTLVQVDNKELVNAVIEAAKVAAKIQDAGSATVKFYNGNGTQELVPIVNTGDLTAVVEFVKVAH